MAFLAGVWLVQQLPTLPALEWTWLALPLIGLVRWLPAPLAWGAGGLLWAFLHAHWLSPPPLPLALVGADVLVEGRIASIPEISKRGTRVDLDALSLELDGQTRSWPRRVRLAWYGQVPPLSVGERWRFSLRLKPLHGLMNPGGFDYEGWLFQHGISAQGTVRADPAPLQLDQGHWTYGIGRLRQHLGEALARQLPSSPYLGLVQGLAIAETQAVSASQWEVLRRTGTTHLLAISGSHIAIVTGLVFFLGRWLWSRAGSAPLWLAAPRAAALAALLAAFGYAALAGFPVPTQRAVVMVGVAMGAILVGRALHPGRTLALALLAVLVWDPLAVTAAGFWLSFGAVAAILYGLAGRVSAAGLGGSWGRVQWLVTVGLLPLMLTIFHQVSLYAPLANLVAIPWIEVGIVPLLLAGTLLLPWAPDLGGWLVNWADLALGELWPLLETLAAWPGATWSPPAAPAWALALGLAGALLLLAPRGLPGRWLGLLALAPLLWPNGPRPAPGDLWLEVLDVGQGLAVVARTQTHALVYDTGPRFGAERDAGSSVLAPFLRQAGVTQVDLLLVSHADQDHDGGSQSLREALPVRAMLGSGGEACAQGQAWNWDGVDFQLLHPPAGGTWRGNDASCVLRVTWADGSLLLSGDIGWAAEAALVAHHGAALASQVLVAPHHGSARSSSPAFVAATRPQLVIYSSGFRNRFGFPRPEVVERYAGVGAQAWNTASQGAIQIRLGPGKAPQARGWRDQARRYWHWDGDRPAAPAPEAGPEPP